MAFKVAAYLENFSAMSIMRYYVHQIYDFHGGKNGSIYLAVPRLSICLSLQIYILRLFSCMSSSRFNLTL